MKSLACFLVVFIAIAVSPWANAGDLEDGITAIPADRGLVVLSTSGTRVRFALGSFLELADPASKRLYVYGHYLLDPPRTLDESAFTDELGRIHQIFLPPGEYAYVPELRRLRDWYLPVYKFTVSAGAAIYVGNFWLGDKTYEVRDSQVQRDLDVFRKKNPALNSLSISAVKLEKYCEKREFDTLKLRIFTDPTQR
jgi:hypothetical protein